MDHEQYRRALRAYVRAVMRLERTSKADRAQFEKVHAQAEEARKAYEAARKAYDESKTDSASA